MPFLKSLPADAGPAAVFRRYPEIYSHWVRMSQALMNGPAALTPGERELIAAYVVGLVDCPYAYAAHAAAATEWGFEEGLTDKLLADLDTAPVDAKLKPLLAFAKKLTLTPSAMTQADADAIFAAGWDERALHDTVAVTARMCFMNRLVEGFGVAPMNPERAKEDARRRIQLGYLDRYPEFTEAKREAQ